MSEQPSKMKTYAKGTKKNITVDADILDMLTAVGDDLEGRLGFRPTHSQTLRWLIKHSDVTGPSE